MNNIGIIGGSFDPVHNGHLLLAETVRERLGLNRVLFMPTRIQPFKQDKEVSSVADRIMMLAMGLKGDENFSVTRVEIDDPEISYTIHSLEKLREELGEETKLHFIIGGDMFVNIGKWHRAEDLLRNFAFVMGRRPGAPDDEAEALAETWRRDYGAEISFVENPLFQVSSSEIRSRVAEGRSIRYLVPEKVREYIYESNLYR